MRHPHSRPILDCKRSLHQSPGQCWCQQGNLQVLESTPQVLESAPRVLESEPQVLASVPQVLESAPQVLESAQVLETAPPACPSHSRALPRTQHRTPELLGGYHWSGEQSHLHIVLGAARSRHRARPSCRRNPQSCRMPSRVLGQWGLRSNCCHRLTGWPTGCQRPSRGTLRCEDCP